MNDLIKQINQQIGVSDNSTNDSGNSLITNINQQIGLSDTPTMNNSGTTPTDVTNALNSNLPVNPNTGNTNYDGWCQAFVEQTTGSGYKGNSAVDAWNNYANQGQAIAGTQGIKPGDLIYFSPNDSNNNAGHTGIYMGNDKFVSATYGGVQVNDLNQWQQKNAPVLGYVPIGGQQ